MSDILRYVSIPTTTLVAVLCEAPWPVFLVACGTAVVISAIPQNSSDKLRLLLLLVSLLWPGSQESRLRGVPVDQPDHEFCAHRCCCLDAMPPRFGRRFAPTWATVVASVWWGRLSGIAVGRERVTQNPAGPDPRAWRAEGLAPISRTFRSR